MARLSRDARLETREARSRLASRHAPYWRRIHMGLAIGYRKGPRGGTWLVRKRQADTHIKRGLGIADDHADADGLTVLDYKTAHRRALAFADVPAGQALPADPTMGEVMTYYLTAQQDSKSYRETERAIEAHILPTFEDRRVSTLTTAELRQWHQDLARQGRRRRGKPTGLLADADAETVRRRRVTANRILTVFKAACNHAWRDELLPHAELWRRLKPFPAVDQPRVRFLSEAEALRLQNACAAEFRVLVRAALLTGARYGELTRLQVRDFNATAGTLTIATSKAGRARHVPLTGEGTALFEQVTAGKVAGALVFTRSGTEPWGASHQHRRMREACTAAKITPPIGFHILRHSYASALVQRGVPLQVIAAALGHADTRMTQRHYAHTYPDHVADTIRAHLPAFGEAAPSNVVSLPAGKAAQ